MTVRANAAPGTVDMQRVANYLRDLRAQLPKYVEAGAARMARHTAAAVRERYLSYGVRPWGLSKTVLELGKEYGPLSQRPSRRPLAPTSVFDRLGLAVNMSDRGGSRTRAWRIQIDPGAKHPHATLAFRSGVPLWLIAYTAEARKVSVMRYTHLMRTYLRLMRERRGGFGTRKRTKAALRSRILSNPTLGVFVLRPPYRPVWSVVWESRVPELLTDMASGIARDVAKLTRRHGGRPEVRGSVLSKL